MANNTSNIITGGYGFPQNIITQGFYSPDPRCKEEIPISNGFILQGMNSDLTQDLIVKGFNATFSSLFKKVLEFDSRIKKVEEFDSPLINKDLITRKFNMWI